MTFALPLTAFVLLQQKSPADAPEPGLPRVNETASEMLRVAWSPVAQAEHYVVTIKPLGEDSRVATLESSSPTAQVPDLKPSTKYKIRVRAALPHGDSTRLSEYSPTATVSTTPESQPKLLIPQSLRAENTTPAAVQLTWEHTVGATGYEVQYTKDADFKKKPSLKRTDKTAIDLTLLDGDVEWQLRVRAIGELGATSNWSTPTKITTRLPDDPVPVRAASYNVLCHSCGGTSWGQRRSQVASLIDKVRPDVVGLQEALQSRPSGFSVPQFVDLVTVLNDLGNDYVVTNSAVGASKGERIIYRRSKLSLLASGQFKYSSQLRGATSRYGVWAKFRQRTTGREFFFFTTHLEPKSSSVRLSQARQMAGSISHIAGKSPAIAVGDYNASQFSNYAVHQAMTAAEMIDPLGVQASSRVPSKEATVEKRIRTNYDTFNGYRSAPHMGTSNKQGNGTYLDYIFTTAMRVTEFEVVMNLDDAGRFIRPIPSDHNMLRADVLLPDP